MFEEFISAFLKHSTYIFKNFSVLNYIFEKEKKLFFSTKQYD